MTDYRQYVALAQLQHTTRKILDSKWVGVALALPPDDPRRIHYENELERLLGIIDNDRETCAHALHALELDAPKWRRDD